jgi:hypothetical protein
MDGFLCLIRVALPTRVASLSAGMTENRLPMMLTVVGHGSQDSPWMGMLIMNSTL